MTKRVVVVGAGAIGLACAYALRKRGWTVTVLDAATPGDGCSKGNAGWITPSLSAPIPAPGLTTTSIKWMLTPDSPLYIRPGAVPGLARWLWRFWRACNDRDHRRGLEAVAELNRDTFASFDRLEREGLQFELHRAGLLFVFERSSHLHEALSELGPYPRYGYQLPGRLGASEVVALEPSLRDDLAGGFLIDREYHVRPETLTTGLTAKLADWGVEIRSGVTVTGPLRSANEVVGVTTDADPVPADRVLIAAGATSGELAARFGVRLPVQAGKGYSLTLAPGQAPRISRPIYLGEAKIGCSPFVDGVRFAGTMELSGINTNLDRRRLRGIRTGVGRFLRDPVPEGVGIEWVGMRPLAPDGLPMLGRLPGHPKVFLATGHAMLGITLAPVTGELMAELIEGGSEPAVLRPFDPGRFRW